MPPRCRGIKGRPRSGRYGTRPAQASTRSSSGGQRGLPPGRRRCSGAPHRAGRSQLARTPAAARGPVPLSALRAASRNKTGGTSRTGAGVSRAGVLRIPIAGDGTCPGARQGPPAARRHPASRRAQRPAPASRTAQGPGGAMGRWTARRAARGERPAERDPTGRSPCLSEPGTPPPAPVRGLTTSCRASGPPGSRPPGLPAAAPARIPRDAPNARNQGTEPGRSDEDTPDQRVRPCR